MTEQADSIAAFLEQRRRGPHSLAELRAREAESRRSWALDTEQIAQTLPEILRNGYRVGQWMKWAGHVLLMRASWLAVDAGDPEPNRATWARAFRLIEHAEVVMGAATRWLLWQEMTKTPRYIFRAGQLEPEAPPPVAHPAAAPPDLGRLTLSRIADAVSLIALGPRLSLSSNPAPQERFVAQRLVEALTGRRRPVSPMLQAVAGRCAAENGVEPDEDQILGMGPVWPFAEGGLVPVDERGGRP